MGGGGGGAAVGGGGGGGGGGTVDPLPNYVSVAGTANGWTLTDQLPTGQRPYYYSSIRGTDATHLWVAGPFGDVWFFNGSSTWTLVYDDPDSSLVLEDLIITSSGLIAVAARDRLLTCAANCTAAMSFDGPPRTGKYLRGLCTRGTSLYAVGSDTTSGNGVLFEYTNNAWSEVALPIAVGVLSSCHVLSDGRVLLGGGSIWRRETSGALTEEVVRPSFGVPPLVWQRFVESDGRVFAMGTFSRIAQRRPDESWKPVYEPQSGGTGLFDAWPLGNQDILFVGGPPSTRIILSGTTFTRLPDPVDFTAFGVWALDANTHWLAGERQITTSNRAAFVIKASR